MEKHLSKISCLGLGLTFESLEIDKKTIYPNLDCVPMSKIYSHNGIELGRDDFTYSRNAQGRMEQLPTRTKYSDFYIDENGEPVNGNHATLPKIEVVEVLTAKVFSIVAEDNFKKMVQAAILSALVKTFPTLESRIKDIIGWYRFEVADFKDFGFFDLIDSINDEADADRLSKLNFKPYGAVTGHPLQQATIKNLVLARFMSYLIWCDSLVYVTPNND